MDPLHHPDLIDISRTLRKRWEQVVDAWQLETWEAYRDVIRLGRKTRLPEKQRVVLWSIFERVRADLNCRDMVTTSDIFSMYNMAAPTSSTPSAPVMNPAENLLRI